MLTKHIAILSLAIGIVSAANAQSVLYSAETGTWSSLTPYGTFTNYSIDLPTSVNLGGTLNAGGDSTMTLHSFDEPYVGESPFDIWGTLVVQSADHSTATFTVLGTMIDNGAPTFAANLYLQSTTGDFSQFTNYGIGNTSFILGPGVASGQIFATFNTPVPEPSGLAIIGLGAGALLIRRKR